MIQQDSGAWVLAGTVSHGIKCAYPDLPGVYMRMTYYKPWIEKVTGTKFRTMKNHRTKHYISKGRSFVYSKVH